MTLHNLGEVAQYQGNFERAAELYTQSMAFFRALGDHWALSYSLVGLGNLAGYQDNDAQATAFYQEALSFSQEGGYSELLAECFEGLAGSAAKQAQSARAARLLGAAEQLREVIDAPRHPVKDERHAKAIALAQDALDPIAYESAWRDGRRMTLEEAIKYALSDES
jgi:tetratricopeptide (TPR) repeat protein